MLVLRGILSGLVLFMAAWIALTPFLKGLEVLYDSYKKNQVTSSFSIFPGPLLPSLLLGISYPLYGAYSWAKTCAVAIVVVDLSFILFICLSLLSAHLKKRKSE